MLGRVGVVVEEGAEPRHEDARVSGHLGSIARLARAPDCTTLAIDVRDDERYLADGRSR
ncbi:MAG: hypothetical protein SangKO_090860 [Sandaracinaceae bacterium]